MSFKKATRTQAKLKIAMTGPSGSGKTFSSLLLAKGMAKKIAFVDTENHSASLYADRFEFDELTLSPPFTVQKYIQAIQDAVKGGYEVLIIDSLTHAWAGEGGLLAKKEALDSRGGNSYTNWASITKEHEALKNAFLQSPIHLIATMRSKQDYILELNEKGKSQPKKVGLAPIQRDGMEYEFTTVFDIGMDHQYVASKDRTGLFDGVIEKITESTGEKLISWLSSAHAPDQGQTNETGAPLIASEPAQVQTSTVGAGGANSPTDGRRRVINHATNESVTLAPTTNNSIPNFDDDQPEDMAKKELDGYTVPFGKKWYGRTLDEIGLHESKKYRDWLAGEAKRQNKQVTGVVAEFCDKVYLFEQLLIANESKPPGIDLSEQIPF
jgi:hypothetical protein